MADFITIDENTQLKAQLTKLVNAKIEELLAEIKKTLPAKARAIQGEIYSIYRSIIENTVEETFLESYGDSINLQSLRESIIYSSMNDFRPDFSYNVNKVKFYPSDRVNTRWFNQNARQNAKTSRPLHSDNVSIWDLYNLRDNDEYYDNEDDEWEATVSYWESLQGDSKPVNSRLIMNGLNGDRTIQDTFEKAKVEALRKFNNEYDIHIKPQILKKYGVKLGKMK